MSQDIPVGLMTGLREGQRRKRGSISSEGKKLLFCLNFRTGSRAFRCLNSACGGAFPRFKPLNTELNPICPLLALLGAHHILHFSRIRIKRLRCKIYHSFPSIAQIENEWICTITYPYAFIE
jgi:hypothetical protein